MLVGTIDALSSVTRIAEHLHKSIDLIPVLKTVDLPVVQASFAEVIEELELTEECGNIPLNCVDIVDSLIAECHEAVERIEDRLLNEVSARPFQ